jgi:DNA-binding XRE family transcriptional regulator
MVALKRTRAPEGSTSATTVDQTLEEVRSSREGLAGYQSVQFPALVADTLVERMMELEISQSELAERLGVSRGRMSQILSGDQNMTLRTLASVASALDAMASVRLFDAEKEGFVYDRSRQSTATDA